MKEVDFKLKVYNKERADHFKYIVDELDSLKPIDFEDFNKNHEIIKKVKEIKNKIKESDIKLKDLEVIQKDVVKKLTEINMENSIDLLGLKT